jgi:flagellar biosynthesis protein FlhG
MTVPVKDQASRLRTLAKDLDVSSRAGLVYSEQPRQIFDLLFISGKNGVGKTTLAISFAIALRQMGKKVLLVDLDFTSNSFPVYFDTIVEGGLLDIIKHDIEIKDLVQHHSSGVDFVANHVDFITDFKLTKNYRTRIITSLDRIKQDYDYVLGDSSGGISENVLLSSELAKKLLYITTTDPISIIDTYSLLKYLNQEERKQKFEVIINMVQKEKHYKESVEKLNTALEKFLAFSDTHYHNIAHNKNQLKRVQEQKISQVEDKHHGWAKEIRKISKTVIKRT